MSYLAFLVGVALLAGCATHKSFTPAIEAPKRQGLEVSSPIALSVLDGRANKGNGASTDAAEQLAADLKAIYGGAVQRVGYFTESSADRTRINIRIRTLGADFGSRVITRTAVQQAFSKADVVATIDWETLIGKVRQRQNLLAAGTATEGWWIGTAWLDLTIQPSQSNGREINFPLVAEARQSNTFGYKSAEDATQQAWRKVSSDLLFVIDELLTGTN